MRFSRRLDQLAPYPFVEISRILAAKRGSEASTGWHNFEMMLNCHSEQSEESIGYGKILRRFAPQNDSS